MSERKQPLGFEPFDCAPALRLEAHEALQELQLEALRTRLVRLEAETEQMERRIWLTVYGVVAVILAQAFKGILPFAM